MTWKSTIRKSGVDAGQLAKEFTSYVMKKLISDLESEGYEEVNDIVVSKSLYFQAKIQQTIELYQMWLDDAILNDDRFDSKTKERLR